MSDLSLNQSTWQEKQLNPGIRARFIEIASRYIEILESSLNPVDVVITGSLVNYGSDGGLKDVDVNVVVDYDSHDDLANEDFYFARSSMFDNHVLVTVDALPVLSTLQHASYPYCRSRGAYSLIRNVWVVEPGFPFVDREDVIRQANKYEDRIKELVRTGSDLTQIISEIYGMRVPKSQVIGDETVDGLTFRHLYGSGIVTRLVELQRSQEKKSLLFQLDQVSNGLKTRVSEVTV